jgi:hypothetical protein
MTASSGPNILVEVSIRLVNETSTEPARVFGGYERALRWYIEPMKP